MKNYSKKKAKPESKENAVQGKKSEIKIPYVIGGVLLALLAVGVIYLLKDKNVIPPLLSQKYITEESDVHMPTTPEGTTEKITDVSGNELIVTPSGTYTHSPFAANSLDKLMDGKVVPLVGSWTTDTSSTKYVFKNDQTFEIIVQYGTEEEPKECVFTGKVVINNVNKAVSDYKVKNMDGLYEKLQIDTNTFIKDNLYYVTLAPEYSYTTDEPEPLKVDLDDPDSPKTTKRYLLYTYWLEDIDRYYIKVCPLDEPFTNTYMRVD
jgi:hypothetical protein